MVKRDSLLAACGLLLGSSLLGCTVPVASLQLATTRPVSAERLQTAVSRGWREGDSCRFWLLIPYALPHVDEAIENATAPVDGFLMRDVEVWSWHPTYGLFGWNCYWIRGEVFG